MRDVTKHAVRAAGGSNLLAKALGITRQAVEDWREVPPRHVLHVETLSGISRHVIRPDVYGPAPDQPKRRSESRVA